MYMPLDNCSSSPSYFKMYNQHHHFLHHACITTTTRAEGALNIIVLAQEGLEPELHVVLYHLNKPIAMYHVVEEVTESHHLCLCAEDRRGIHDGAALVMATATTFTMSEMKVMFPTSSS